MSLYLVYCCDEHRLPRIDWSNTRERRRRERRRRKTREKQVTTRQKSGEHDEKKKRGRKNLANTNAGVCDIECTCVGYCMSESKRKVAAGLCV